MRPLNIFQRVMRIWEEAHPYNAAQIMRVGGLSGDVTLISAAWNAAVAAAGLGEAKVVGGKFCYEPAAPQQAVVVEAGEDADAALNRFITSEINRPFSAGGRGDSLTMPFRPFIIHAGDGTHYLGAIYQHWVADSVSMRMLMREWFCRLFDPHAISSRPLHMPLGGFWRYFGPGRAGWHLGEGLTALLDSMSQFATARQIENERGPQDVECSVHRLRDGMVEGLLDAARRRRMTLNDLFLAALARACDQHGADPRNSRRDMAMGSIVDLRATSAENLENTFGMFLGFTALIVPGGALEDRERLLAGIAVKNARQKETKAAQSSVLRMAAGYVQGKYLTPQQLAAFYRKYMPFSGGVSNVNMNRAWPAKYYPAPLLDYIRVAPTGPMVPVVIAVTTMGNRLTFVLTRRASLVDAARGARLAETFLDELTVRAKTG